MARADLYFRDMIAPKPRPGSDDWSWLVSAIGRVGAELLKKIFGGSQGLDQIDPKLIEAVKKLKPEDVEKLQKLADTDPEKVKKILEQQAQMQQLLVFGLIGLGVLVLLAILLR